MRALFTQVQHDSLLASSLILVMLCFSGCSRDTDRASLMKKITPPHEESLALRYLELLRQRRFEEIEEHLDPTLRNDDAYPTLAGMAELFPNREPASIKTVDATFVRSLNSTTTNITLEYEFATPTGTEDTSTDDLRAHSWLLGQVAIDEKGSGAGTTITGIHVIPIPKPLEVLNEFTLTGKGIDQYAGLFLAILNLVFCLWTLVLCIRTKIVKAKAFCFILIPIGICQLTVNWTTGQYFFSPWSMQLPPVTIFSSPYGPWMLNISAPVGALALLVLRKRLASARQSMNATLGS